MIIKLPEWYMKAQEDLDKVVMDIALRHGMSYRALNDSKSIDEAKEQILSSLVWIYENVNVEDRIRQEKFIDEMEKLMKKEKADKKKAKAKLKEKKK